MWLVCLLMGLLLVGYCVGQMLTKEYVTCVEAGPMTGVTAEDLRRKSFYATRMVLLKDGKEVPTQNMIRIVVNGDCMQPRNIIDGTQLYVEKIAKGSDVRNTIQPGDLLLLYLPDIKMYKIREFKGFTAEGAMQTLYYDANGTEQLSSIPHKLDTLVGVVKYRI